MFTFLFSFFICNVIHADSHPELFLFFGPSEQTGGYNEKLNLKNYQNILSNPCVEGAQVVYTWKELEPEKGVYNFSRIEKDLNFLDSIHKKLFIQLQDRSFQPNVVYVPDYIRKDQIYHGGVAMQYDFSGPSHPITEGWVARVWDPAVNRRFQILIKRLAKQFDGRIYGINLPETAVNFDPKNPPEGFTSDKYFHAELENIRMLRQAFHQSFVIQYVNFFPNEWNNDHNYMGRLFSYAVQHNIGLGGPDVIPYRTGQMKNSYPFFHKYKGKINPVGMAIQEPDYTYKNPNTNHYYNFSDFYSFANNYLGATILFWSTKQPFLSKELTPEINPQHFECNIYADK